MATISMTTVKQQLVGKVQNTTHTIIVPVRLQNIV